MPTPSLHVPTLVRAALLVVLAVFLVRIYAFDDVISPRVEGWIAFVLVEILLLAAAGRLVWLDARAPGPRVYVARTRELPSIIEIIIAGAGAGFLFAALFISLAFGADEVRYGRVRPDSGPKGGELVPAAMLGAFGFFMVFWRPTFWLDLDRREVRRLAFGRALPLRVATHPLSSVQIIAEGYYRTNTGVRYGDMIRGQVGDATFELQFIPGNVAPQELAYAVHQWQQALGTGGPAAPPQPASGPYPASAAPSMGGYGAPMGAWAPPGASPAPMNAYAPQGGPPAPMNAYAPQGGPPAPMNAYAPQGGPPAPTNAYAPQGAPSMPVPRGWMWGYLHLRAANIKGFGFLYVDPVGGPSFHVVADMYAPLDPAGLHAAGYRGARTVRLGAYETLYTAPGIEQMQRQSFEEGSVTGAVVLALSPAEMASLALPPMPPWAHHYLRAGMA